MAWENYGWVWNVVGVKGSEYNVLICLANEANSKGVTPRLKVDKIMRRCNLARRSVFEYTKRLEDKGFIAARNKQFSADGSIDACEYVLDKTRYFPKGTYDDALGMWHQVTTEMEKFTRISRENLRLLTRIREAFYQRNAKVLYLISETDLYEEVMFDHLHLIKEASAELKLPIRRFEVFRKPYLK